MATTGNDWRSRLGAGLLRFLKLGRLTFGGGGEIGRSLFETRSDELHKSYEQNVWAYRGINAIASSAGQIPWIVATKNRAGKLEPIEGHPLIELLENPNPFMTRQDLIEYLFIFAESSGVGYWLFDNGEGKGLPVGSKLKLSQVKEIWPIPSFQVKAKPHTSDFIESYLFDPGMSGKPDELAVSEVLEIKYPSPAALLSAQGAIRCVKGDLAADLYAQAFERFIMRNLSANIVFLKTAGVFGGDQREDYRKALAQVFRGVKIGFMENGLDFATPQIAAKDLPFLELDARRQKRILGALGVPPIMAGSEDAKYDNAEQQKAFFWGDTMRPKLSRVGGMLTKKLHALGEDKRLVVVPDLSEVRELQKNHLAQAQTAKVWIDAGYPLNQAIRDFGIPGMEDVEGGDVGLVDAGKIPIESAAEPSDPIDPEGTPEDAPPPEEDAPPGKPKKSFDAEERASRSDKALDDARWKQFLQGTEPGFRRLRVEIRRFFKSQRAAVLSAIRLHVKGLSMGELRDPRVDLIMSSIPQDGDSKELAKSVKPILRSIYQKLGKQAVADVGASIAFNVNSPLAARFLDVHVFKFTFEANRVTRERIADVLRAKFNEGKTSKEVADAVQAQFDFFERYRAVRIARTESGIAGNSGIYDGLTQAGIESKRWISARDEKVRDTHKIADGQEVGIEELFDVGGSLLRYPGDPDGPASEIINCRCVVRAPRVKE